MRRRYLPRRRRGSPQAHQAAAQKAAAAQAAAPQAPSRNEQKTNYATTSNRNLRLTRFKPGFEEDTEKQLAKIFKRPPRTYKEDPPFYPWLPITPKVIFALNFKG
nr:MAG: hypothetical protein [Gammatorquevirus sp.]